jgi:uncharacterized protein
MIDLDESNLQEVLKILGEHVPECEVWAYGSRVKGTARKFSDLDLALVGQEPLGWKRVEALKYAFSASDLPIMVAVVDFNSVSDSFRSNIRSKYEMLRRPVNTLS